VLHEIREEASYAECVERLGGYEYIDEFTGHLRWRLARDPVGQSFAVPNRRVRLTFTEELREDVPVMRVILQILDSGLVSLRWIENVDDAPPIGFDDWL
jgi:hypothetical protein